MKHQLVVEQKLRIERVWAMPDQWTFKIKPIAKLLKEEITGGVWIDPYAGQNSPAQITNDISPNSKAQYHMDAFDFLKAQASASADGILFDPPYTLRQLKECYENALQAKAPAHIFNAKYNADQKDQIGRIIKPGGKAICFGYNSIGIGKTRGFRLERVLLVAHGRMHNDTIITVERKVNGSLFWTSGSFELPNTHGSWE